MQQEEAEGEPLAMGDKAGEGQMQARERALHSGRGFWMPPLIKVDLLQGQRKGIGCPALAA